MSVALVRNVEKPVTLATTVTRLTREPFSDWRQLCVLALTSGAATKLYVVTGDVPDGDALPAAGRQVFELSQLPLSLDISPYGIIGLAGDAAGDIDVVIR